jgi:hypothetical protein
MNSHSKSTTKKINKMKRSVLITAIAIAAFTTHSFAQESNSSASHDVTISIPEVALLDLEGASTITLAPTAPEEAGLGLSFASATDNSVWVNYSSVVGSGENRSVNAKISGTVPSGLQLKVSAGSYSGNGKGTTGTASGQIVLSGTDQELISSIGSGYTGNGTNNGHNLTYQLDLDPDGENYQNLMHGDTEITVTYTLTDN